MTIKRRVMTFVVIALLISATFLLATSLSFHSYQKFLHTSGGNATYEFELVKPSSSNLNAVIMIDDFGPYNMILYFQNGTRMNVTGQTVLHIHLNRTSNGYSPYYYRAQSSGKLSYLHPFQAEVQSVNATLVGYPSSDGNVYSFYVTCPLGVDITVYVVGEYL